MRRLIIVTLERACTLLDRLGADRVLGRHYLAEMSDRLDQHWKTGVWT